MNQSINEDPYIIQRCLNQSCWILVFTS